MSKDEDDDYYGEFPPLADAIVELRDLKARAASRSLPLGERYKAEQQAIGAESVLRKVRTSFQRRLGS